ncbi:hypothetical protein BDB01DRAFT_815123 [Pilobolus umbonatus]|nr:hypothetical protein BDB01DRAFT_815123 [Pilobolus umbonatus]
MTTPHLNAYNGCQSEVHMGRPSYPLKAVEMVGQLLKNKDKHVVDLGSGTELQVTAVEPLDNMRHKLMELLPDVPALKGTAWNISVESASQDMIMLAQCFYWFNEDIQSLRELQVLIWNIIEDSNLIHLPNDIWTRILSKSYVAIVDKKSQNQLHEDVEKVINDPQYDLPKNDTPFIYKHDTNMYWTSKK